MRFRDDRRPGGGASGRIPAGRIAILALVSAACWNRPDATVRVRGTIRAPAGADVVCTMTCADARGRVLATHPVAGHFNVPVPVSSKPRTYRFDFRCDGFADVSTALTLRALPGGQEADIGTIALGPAGGSDR